MFKPTLTTLALVAAMVALPVAAKVINVPFQYEAMSKAQLDKLKKNGVPSSSNCAFTVSGMVDARQNTQSFAFNGSNLQATGVDSWFLAATKAHLGYAEKADSKINIEVKPTLVRMYSYPESMNINAVLAVQVDFSVNGMPLETRKYRGFDSKSNWANGDSEYFTALNNAVNNLLPKVSADLASVCALASKS